MTKKQRLNIFCTHTIIVGLDSAGNREIEHSNNRTSLRISLSGEIIMYIESSSRFKFMKVKNNFN